MKFYFENHIFDIFSSHWTSVRPNKGEKFEWKIEKSIQLEKPTKLDFDVDGFIKYEENPTTRLLFSASRPLLAARLLPELM